MRASACLYMCLFFVYVGFCCCCFGFVFFCLFVFCFVLFGWFFVLSHLVLFCLFLFSLVFFSLECEKSAHDGRLMFLSLFFLLVL